MGLKHFIEKIEPAFLPGGKYEKWYALFEATATFLYTPGTVTHKASHVRDALDSKRMMVLVWLSLFLRCSTVCITWVRKRFWRQTR